MRSRSPDAVLAGFAEAVTERPRRVVAAIALVAVVAGLLVPSLQTDMSPQELSAGVEAQDEIDRRFEAAFGNPDNVVLILLEAEDVLAPSALGALVALESSLGARDYVRMVRSIASLPLVSGRARPESAVQDFTTGRARLSPAITGSPPTASDSDRVRAALARTPVASETLLSDDHQLALLVVELRSDIDRDPEIAPVVADIEKRVESIRKQHGAQLSITGLPYLHTWILEQVDRDQYTLFPAAIIMTLLLLLVTFRWWPALVLPAAAVGVSALVVIAGMAAIGEPLNIINNIIPILIIIVGISDSIHLLNRYGEELQRGNSRLQAARLALRSMAVALLLTSLTTAVGFASLMVSKMEILRNFGLTAAAGMMVAYLVTVLLLPAVLTLVPPPRRPLADPEAGLFERLTVRWVRLLIGPWRLPALAGATLLMAAGVWLALGVPVENNHSDQFDDDDQVFHAVGKLERVTGLQSIEVMLSASDPQALTGASALDAIDAAAGWLREQNGVGAVVGYNDFLRTVWLQFEHDEQTTPFAEAPLAQLIALGEMGGERARRFSTADHSVLRLSVYVDDIGGPAVLALAEQLRTRLERDLAPVPGLRVELSGEGYVSSRGLEVVTRDLMTSLLLAGAVIFGFLTLVMRSLRLGLLSVPSNLLPLATTMMYMRLRGIPLSPATVIIFSISIGLAVDGTIHVLSRFREELAAGLDRDAALTAAAAGSGKAVLVSYLSLIVGFSLLQLSGFLPIRLFGELISVTVAGCLLATLIVLPPVVSTFWPKRRDSL
jgi:predicted RND superfamily exporter protein